MPVVRAQRDQKVRTLETERDGQRLAHAPFVHRVGRCLADSLAGQALGELLACDGDHLGGELQGKELLICDLHFFEFQRRRQKTGKPNMQGVSAGDLDGDGRPDVAALSFDGHLYGLRGSDGQLLWKTPIPGGGWSKPVVTRLGRSQTAQVLVVSSVGRLHVIDARTGDQLWATNLVGGGKVAGHPAVVEKDGRTIILAPLGGAGVVAFDWGRRTELWRSPKGFPVIASPVVTHFGGAKGASVIVASATGNVWVLNLTDGQPIWHDRVVDGIIEADPVVSDLDGDGFVDILIAGHDFKLHALSGAGSLGALR